MDKNVNGGRNAESAEDGEGEDEANLKRERVASPPRTEPRTWKESVDVPDEGEAKTTERWTTRMGEVHDGEFGLHHTFMCRTIELPVCGFKIEFSS
jgi:hypothetical protein